MSTLYRATSGTVLKSSNFNGLKGRSLPRRLYHDESFGFRKLRERSLPDYSRAQLESRVVNAPLLRYVDSMRTHGHRAARIDPLDLMRRDEVAALDHTRYGLGKNMDKKYVVDGIVWNKHIKYGHDDDFGGDVNEEAEWWTLGEVVNHMREIYVGRIAYEYMHSPHKDERLWFSHHLEETSYGSVGSPGKWWKDLENKKQGRIWELIAKSEVFDQFLQAKFPNLKRYGLEGGESMLPALDTLFRLAAQAGVEHIVLSMPHRGRLNLLTDILQYSPTALFHKVKGNSEFPDILDVSGDVISHLVASPTIQYEGAKAPLKISLLPNPSHLEAVNPVALGKARAKQFSLLKSSYKGVDPDECALGDKVMCVQLHGDASFTGQGVVMETLGLSNLPHFTSGGSVHVVVNNNIGYTTPASEARSSLYCSDIGKMIHAPVLHVNGDYPEDVARAMDTAFKYRNYWRKDVIVDLMVYRRWGHNELDEPAFTQPLMYEKIRSRNSVPQLYEDKLISEQVITKAEAESVRQAYKAQLDEALAKVGSFTPNLDLFQDQWKGMVWPASKDAQHDPETGFKSSVLDEVAKASVRVPDGFEIHPRLQRHVKHRLQSIEQGKGIDWATAEAMAFGSLMKEGYDVRISGQDVGRGTFSHRHAMLVDQKTENTVVPLNNELQAEGKLELANSSLSEMAVMGFEVGVSWERPTLLPIWEAQFGDFFNGAQIIIDTFVSSAETKWLKQSGLVLLLPHGLDGAGPEHSSSRIERWLQLTNDRFASSEDESYANPNIHVVYPTTPAQYFHLLRRQMKRNFRKPLVVAAPKGLLRLPASTSGIENFEIGTRFEPVLSDPAHTNCSVQDQVERVVLLSGKIYYDLYKERQSQNLESKIALIRIEELCPFPFSHLRTVLKQYWNAKEWMWVQEEPRNQGAWGHVKDRLQDTIGGGKEVKYVGRKESAVPAPGIGKIYREQQNTVIEGVFEEL